MNKHSFEDSVAGTTASEKKPSNPQELFGCILCRGPHAAKDCPDAAGHRSAKRNSSALNALRGRSKGGQGPNSQRNAVREATDPVANMHLEEGARRGEVSTEEDSLRAEMLCTIARFCRAVAMPASLRVGQERRSFVLRYQRRTGPVVPKVVVISDVRADIKEQLLAAVQSQGPHAPAKRPQCLIAFSNPKWLSDLLQEQPSGCLQISPSFFCLSDADLYSMDDRAEVSAVARCPQCSQHVPDDDDDSPQQMPANYRAYMEQLLRQVAVFPVRAVRVPIPDDCPEDDEEDAPPPAALDSLGPRIMRLRVERGLLTPGAPLCRIVGSQAFRMGRIVKLEAWKQGDEGPAAVLDRAVVAGEEVLVTMDTDISPELVARGTVLSLITRESVNALKKLFFFKKSNSSCRKNEREGGGEGDLAVAPDWAFLWKLMDFYRIPKEEDEDPK